MKIIVEEIWFHEDEMLRGAKDYEEKWKEKIYCPVVTSLDKEQNVENHKQINFIPVFWIDKEGMALSFGNKEKRILDLTLENCQKNIDYLLSGFIKDNPDKDVYIYVARLVNDRSLAGMRASLTPLRKLTLSEIKIVKKEFVQ